MSVFNVYPNRYLCSVLEEMREQLKLLDTNNIDKYRSMTALMIEEVQSLGNRMESSLEDVGDLEKLLAKRAKLKKEINTLRIEKGSLQEDGGDDDY